MSTIVIAGSGKMARSIGTWLIDRNNEVIFYSRNEKRADDLRKYITRHVNRLQRYDPSASVKDPAFAHPESVSALVNCDIIIESVEEGIEAKKAVISAIIQRTGMPRLLLSNSSSILPSSIHDRCAGLHFFYPVQTARLVECVVPATYGTIERNALIEFVKDNCMDAIVQNEHNAFISNRLILPLQNECFRLLSLGYDRSFVDRATVSCLNGIGILTAIDSIGPQTVLNALIQYRSRMAPEEAGNFSYMHNGLETAIRRHVFPAAPAMKNPESAKTYDNLPFHFLCLFITSCLYFLENGWVDSNNLDLLLDRVYGAEETLSDTVQKTGEDSIRAYIEEQLKSTGIVYFRKIRSKPTELMGVNG